MRLRDLFRGTSTIERKLTSSLIPVLDFNTFINAVNEKDNETLQKYILAGFPPDQFDPTIKSTALHIAVESGNIRAIQLLLQAGAQVNLYDGSLSTPLHIATYMGYEEIVQILLIHGADIFKQDNTGRNAFHLAVTTGNNRLIQYFLSKTDDKTNLINQPDAHNWTPLMCACASKQQATCAFLLSHHADISAVNDRGMNILHLAAFLGSISLMNEFLNIIYDNKIIINQGDNRNQTPLFYACIEGHFDIALNLINAGANLYHLDHDNQTCLHAMLSSSVIFKRHIRLFFYFIQFVDYRFIQDHFNRTLLDLAYLNQLNSIIYLLILLNYQRNYSIISNHEFIYSTQVLSLRQICILKFKRSIKYQRIEKQSCQRILLEQALQQTFNINLSQLIDINEISYHRKSLDDISILSRKNRKTRKNINEYETTMQSNWSIFTNKLKPIRINSNQYDTSLLEKNIHPMKNLVLMMFLNQNKLNNLLDFPSLNHNYLLENDLKTIMNGYHLQQIDLSNEI